jgi:hypothetical protein
MLFRQRVLPGLLGLGLELLEPQEFRRTPLFSAEVARAIFKALLMPNWPM